MDSRWSRSSASTTGLLHGRHASGPRTQFLLECLSDLDGELRARGSGLVVRHGPPERELPALAREVGAEAIHVTAGHQPVRPQARRAHAPTPASSSSPTRASTQSTSAQIETKAGKPYTVFSPFHRTWLEAPRRDVLAAPRRLPPLPAKLAKGRLPSLEALGLTQEVSDPAPGGEAEARKALDRFLAGPIGDYVDDHDALGRDNTSRLSPYLHFGCVSVRSIEERLPRGNGAEAFRRQLCWRDFHHHVLHHFPAQRQVGVPGPLPRLDQMELRQAAVRGLVRGPHRLPARRRRHAPAAARGLDA